MMIQLNPLKSLRNNTLSAIALALGATAMATSSAIAQQVINAAPTGREVAADTSIAWQFDEVSQVKPGSLKLFVNGEEVTGQTIIDPARNYFGYHPTEELDPGSHNVRIEFDNTQGVGYEATWAFAVPNTTIEIRSMTHNASEEALGSGANFLATINGSPRADASVLLVKNGQTVRTIPASEVSPGVYVATVAVGSQDTVREGILVGRLAQGDRVVYSVAPQSFAFNPNTTNTQVSQTATTQASATETTSTTTAPLELAVTSHSNNAMITSGSGFTLSGTTTPGADVMVNVLASPPRLGPFSVGSPQVVLEDARATVEADGSFSINIPRPTIVQGGMKYAVTVTAEHDGEQEEVELNFTQE